MNEFEKKLLEALDRIGDELQNIHETMSGLSGDHHVRVHVESDE